MKTFLRIWYCLLSVLLIVSLSLGISSAYSIGSSKGISDSALTSANNHIANLTGSDSTAYIREFLTFSGYSESKAVEDDDGALSYPTGMTAGDPVATFAVQQQAMNSEANAALAQKMDLPNGKTFATAGISPSNIVAYIPGKTQDADAVLFYARYNGTYSAASENIPVAALLQNAFEALSLNSDNAIVILFADSADGEDYGLYNFIYGFDGFDGVVERIKGVIDLDSLSAGGAMNLIDFKGNYSFVSKVNAAAGKGMSSSLISSMYKSTLGATDADLFDCAYARIANSDGLNFNVYAEDQEFSAATLRNYCNSVNKLLSVFANYDLSSSEVGAKVLCFNLLGLSITLPYEVSYIFAALIVILLGASVFANMKKKAFTPAGIGKGAAVQFFSLALSAIIMIALYYLMILILSLFAVIPVEAIASLRYSGPGIIACMMLLSVPIITGSQMIFKRVFSCKPADVVRGNIVIAAILGIIGAFIPDFGFVFALLAVLETIIFLISVFCQERYFAKHNDSLGKLFLYILPVILVLPILINQIAIITAYSYLVYLPLLCLLFALMVGFVTPYIGLIKPAMQKLMDKLPKKARRVKHTVVEKVEDKAKKGKFTEKEVVKYDLVYEDRRYRNRYLVIALALIMTIASLIVGGTGVDIGKNITLQAVSDNAFYQNSMIYVYDVDAKTYTFEIYDPLVYKWVSRAIEGFEWNVDKNAYVKNAPVLDMLSREPSVTRGVDEEKNRYFFIVSDYERRSVKLNISGLSGITSIVLTAASGEEEYTIELDGETSIELALPEGFGDFDLTFEGLADGNFVTFEYEETFLINTLEDLNAQFDSSDWSVISDYYGEDINIKGGSVVKFRTSL